MAKFNSCMDGHESQRQSEGGCHASAPIWSRKYAELSNQWPPFRAGTLSLAELTKIVNEELAGAIPRRSASDPANALTIYCSKSLSVSQAVMLLVS